MNVIEVYQCKGHRIEIRLDDGLYKLVRVDSSGTERILDQGDREKYLGWIR